MLMCLIVISQVSAENANNTLTNDTPLSEDLSTLDILQTDENNTNISEYKSFDEIQQQIDAASAGSTITISGKYLGSGTPIKINKKITLEGKTPNGDNYTYAYLNANDLSRIVDVSVTGVILKNIVFMKGNSKYKDGGAINSEIGDTAIYNSIFGFCHGYNGGAVYNCNVYDCVFLNNSARYGGAMYNGSAINCGFGNNTAYHGGAIYDSHTVTTSEFENNHADDDGGAIYSSGSSITVTKCKFINNHAGDDGGAIYGSSATVKNSYFKSNNAKYYGGAMYYGSAHNCAFIMNTAKKGGGMYYGSEYDCSFTWNSPENVYQTNCYESIVAKMQLSQYGSYFGDKTITVKVINSRTNKVVSGVTVTLKFSNGKTVKVKTNSNGIASYKVPFNPGTYSVTSSMSAIYGNPTNVILNNIKIIKAPSLIKPTKLTAGYEATKYFQVKIINSKTKKVIGGVKLLLNVYTGKKAKKVYITTASNGVAKYNIGKLGVGKHKVKISISSPQVSAKTINSQIIVKKASTKTYAPNGIFIYKKADKYYFGVGNKHNGKLIKGIKLKIKVYTGKKAKTYLVKTNKKGVASINTKNLKLGKHKVIVTTPTTSKYKKSSATGTIEISKKTPTYMGYYSILTLYSYGYPSGRIIYAYVKDINGHALHKKITLTHSNGAKNSGYSEKGIYMPGGLYGSVTLSFAGDKTYRPSSYTINFV